MADQTWDHAIGRRVGAYRIVRQIGEGGMGAVFLAERAGEFQQAAIKLLRPGMDSHGFAARFRHERQILASLDHPNIARLFEGGTTEDGRPYFVMEYIDGEPISSYATRHALGVRERLGLFTQVCAAVQYAHQHLVVHRDLKPGNILVTSGGTPKLLDFGIAKLLTNGASRDTEALTQVMGCLMTPDYASPEQVRGAPITTASDVYSLGAVLYQLLAGRSPHRITSGSAAEIERAICDTEQPPPSQATSEPAARQLRGDLDTIVMKALDKEPSRRYGSAGDLSADIVRHLDGLPIQARPQTLAYRAGKSRMAFSSKSATKNALRPPRCRLESLQERESPYQCPRRITGSQTTLNSCCVALQVDFRGISQCKKRSLPRHSRLSSVSLVRPTQPTFMLLAADTRTFRSLWLRHGLASTSAAASAELGAPSRITTTGVTVRLMPSAGAPLASLARYNDNASGVVGGGTLGYNWQTGAFVAGIEVDLDGIGLSNNNNGWLYNAGWRYNNNGAFLVDVTGRLGYAVGPALFYVKGGWAFIDADMNLTNPNFRRHRRLARL